MSSRIVMKKTEWLRSFTPGMVEVGCFQSPKECHTMSVLIARWNACEGKDSKIKLSATYNFDDCTVTVVAHALENGKEGAQ